MPPAIQTLGLTRCFRGGQGIRELNLEVPAGAIYGFLGPNGAGKTTTIRLLLDLLRPDAGEVRLFGEHLDRHHRGALARVGALVETPSLYGHLDGRSNLEVTRRLLGLPVERVDEALRRVDLWDAARQRVREYSLGMRQRLGIALALLVRPRLLVLDEPGNGLDPAGIQDLRRLLRELVARDGMTVFVSSHQLAEVEQIASHVGVLDRGRLRFQGTLAQLRGLARPRLDLVCDAPARALQLLLDAGEQAAQTQGPALRVCLQDRDATVINRLLVQHDIGVSHLAMEQASLESLFFDLTGASPQENAA